MRFEFPPPRPSPRKRVEGVKLHTAGEASIKVRYNLKMFRGLRTAIYLVPDLGAARDWYAKVLDKPPYFDNGDYVGFSAGGYELGLFPEQSADANGIPAAREESAAAKGHGVLAYWGVDDIEQAHERLLTLGARPLEKISDVGGGIKIGAVLDPFGNAFGIIQNPNFKVED